MNISFKKVHPADICGLNRLLLDVKAASPATYDNLTLDTVLKCRNDIIKAVDHSGNMLGCIGVRRVKMEEAGVDNLSYYIDTDYRINLIEFLLLNIPYKFDMVGEYVDSNKILSRMIQEALIANNIGFTAIKLHCPTGETPEFHRSLIDFGFYIDSYDKKKETFTYIKKPDTY